ncbi:hypothetical protein BZA77DRAFT_6500 [Pyronema omphalodes]|nr:hypothetical protein BZA77DRAFT_6500 [Pyronema omphalodes]
MLERALGKAHTAVTLDHAGNFEGAMEAYEDACELLTEVIEMPGQENDREKLYDIRDTYMARIEELRQQMPLLQQNRYERSLPPRPVTEEYADGVSLYTVDDDESTLVPSNAPSLSERNAPVPPRRDSLYVAQETTARVPPLRSMPTHHINPAQLSPIRGSPPRNNIDRELRQPGNRDSFAFGAAALSPRFSPRKAADYGIRRSPSDASELLRG